MRRVKKDRAAKEGGRDYILLGIAINAWIWRGFGDGNVSRMVSTVNGGLPPSPVNLLMKFFKGIITPAIDRHAVNAKMRRRHLGRVRPLLSDHPLELADSAFTGNLNRESIHERFALDKAIKDYHPYGLIDCGLRSRKGAASVHCSRVALVIAGAGRG